MLKIIDVTLPLSARIPTYPGDVPFQMEAMEQIAAGAPYNASRLTLSTHSGTHVDAPSHFEPNGASIDRLPLEILVGKARVVDVPVRERIDRADLEHLDLRDDLRVLLRTRMSGQLRRSEFHEDYVYLTAEAAAYLVRSGIKLVGVDSLSVEKLGSEDFSAHHALLRAGVVVIEGLDLSEAEPGEYDMTCLPLLIEGADGAPARVILRPRP